MELDPVRRDLPAAVLPAEQHDLRLSRYVLADRHCAVAFTAPPAAYVEDGSNRVYGYKFRTAVEGAAQID